MKLKKLGLFRKIPNRFFVQKSKESESGGEEPTEKKYVHILTYYDRIDVMTVLIYLINNEPQYSLEADIRKALWNYAGQNANTQNRNMLVNSVTMPQENTPNIKYSYYSWWTIGSETSPVALHGEEFTKKLDENGNYIAVNFDSKVKQLTNGNWRDSCFEL